MKIWLTTIGELSLEKTNEAADEPTNISSEKEERPIISGYSHFAQEGLNKNDRRYQDIDEVLKASNRANIVAKNLLKAEIKFDLKLIKNNIHKIVNQFVNSAKKTLGNNIVLEYLPVDKVDDVAIFCDSVHLELVMLNICFNANDAMPNGGKILIKTKLTTLNEDDIKLYNWVDKTKFISISIGDPGTGMESEILESIFEPFFTTKSIEQGTALGLSTAFDIVKSHGGFIEVESTLDVGSEFFIHLPIVV